MPPTPPKKESTPYIIGITVGVLALLVLGVVWYYQANKAEIEESVTNTPVAPNTNASIDSPSDGEWITYTNTELGFSFQYPQAFGDVVITSPEAPVPALQTGERIRGTFTAFEGLTFGTMTEDFSYPSEGGIMDTRGFFEDDGAYYFLFTQDKEPTNYPLEPLDVLIADGQKVLLLEDYSFVNERDTIGEENLTFANDLGSFNLAGLMNLFESSYTGLMVVNNDQELFPREEFARFLESFTFTGQPVSTDDWETYTNEFTGYTIQHPPSFTSRTAGDSIWWSNLEGKTVLAVQYREEGANDLTSWYDTAPSEDATLAGIAGKKFVYQYCDAGACGAQTVAIVIQHADKLLGLEFIGDGVLDATEQAILDSFGTIEPIVQEPTPRTLISTPGIHSDVLTAFNGTRWLIYLPKQQILYSYDPVTSQSGQDGTALTQIIGLEGVKSITWNGSVWLIAGDGFLKTYDETQIFNNLLDETKNFTEAAWNGSKWLVVESPPADFQKFHLFNGTSLVESKTLTDYVRSRRIGVREIASNGTVWTFATNTLDYPIFQYNEDDPLVVTNLDETLQSFDGTATSIGWNGSYWLFGGGQSIQRAGENIGPALNRYDRSVLTDLTSSITTAFGNDPVERIVSSGSNWLISSNHDVVQYDGSKYTTYDFNQQGLLIQGAYMLNGQLYVFLGGQDTVSVVTIE